MSLPIPSGLLKLMRHVGLKLFFGLTPSQRLRSTGCLTHYFERWTSKNVNVPNGGDSKPVHTPTYPPGYQTYDGSIKRQLGACWPDTVEVNDFMATTTTNEAHCWKIEFINHQREIGPVFSIQNVLCPKARRNHLSYVDSSKCRLDRIDRLLVWLSQWSP